jgi:hypothetical protein
LVPTGFSGGGVVVVDVVVVDVVEVVEVVEVVDVVDVDDVDDVVGDVSSWSIVELSVVVVEVAEPPSEPPAKAVAVPIITARQPAARPVPIRLPIMADPPDTHGT